jgi:hypothetical protein
VKYTNRCVFISLPRPFCLRVFCVWASFQMDAMCLDEKDGRRGSGHSKTGNGGRRRGRQQWAVALGNGVGRRVLAKHLAGTLMHSLSRPPSPFPLPRQGSRGAWASACGVRAGRPDASGGLLEMHNVLAGPEAGALQHASSAVQRQRQRRGAPHRRRCGRRRAALRQTDSLGAAAASWCLSEQRRGGGCGWVPQRE